MGGALTASRIDANLFLHGAEAHHVPVKQVFESAFADQFAALQRLRERAARGDRLGRFQRPGTSTSRVLRSSHESRQRIVLRPSAK
jgi:hypothetical protein